MDDPQVQGTCINDFEILELIGQGSFGEVYLAQTKNGHQVAIKMMSKEKIKKDRLAERVNQEAEIHMGISHPSIIKLYAVFEDSKNVYLVLEYCPYGDLHRFLKQRGEPFTEEEARAIFRDVVEGVLYLHSHDIIHRDIKLNNILLTHGMKPKIADFGLATQLTTPEEKHMTFCGTPNFISPEIANKLPHGPATDVWSLGCLLYTLLVGHPPFFEPRRADTMLRVRQASFALPPSLSAQASSLICHMLIKNPLERLSLHELLKHPFLKDNCYWQSCKQKVSVHTDSGLGTASSSSSSSSSSRQAALPSRTMDQPSSIFPHSASWSNNILRSSHLHSSEPLGPTSRDLFQKPATRAAIHASALSDNTNLQHHRVPSPMLKRSPSVPILGVEEKSSYCTCSHVNACPSGCVHPSTCHCQTPQQRTTTRPQTLREVVAPLNTTRLQPKRHVNKAAVFHILESGEVCVEFVKKDQDGTVIVDQVCRVSSDGQKVVIFRPSCPTPLAPTPPQIPSLASDVMFTFDSLPRSHWKKYLYAARYVDVIKSVTPKVKLFTPTAKNFFYENKDFEAVFSTGCKILQTASTGGLKVTLSSGETHTFDNPGRLPHLAGKDLLPLWDHFCLCKEKAQSLEAYFETLQQDGGFSYFPVSIGRRAFATPAATNQKRRVEDDKENVEPTSPATSQMTSYNGTIGSSWNPSLLRTTPPSLQGPSPHLVRKTFPGIGKASDMSDGGLAFQFEDGSVLEFGMDPHGYCYIDSKGRSFWYKKDQPPPPHIQEKLKMMESAVEGRINFPQT